ncbi:MAG: NAD(P)-binding protein [Pseudomonadota bacterium]
MGRSIDVAIVGAGPAGLTAALELSAQPGLEVRLFELGRDRQSRPCPADAGHRCEGCGGVCHVVSGFGGCLHDGDGAKISLMPCARHLAHLLGEARAGRLSSAMATRLEVWLGESLQLVGHAVDASWHKTFASHGLSIREYPVAVLPESSLSRVLVAMERELTSRFRLSPVRLGTELIDVTAEPGGFELHLRSAAGAATVHARHLILAGGRRSVRHHASLLRRLGIALQAPASSIGVRLEMPAAWLAAAGRVHPDLKVNWRLDDGHKVKTFCFCAGPGGGRIKLTNYQDAFGSTLISLDGHVVVHPATSLAQAPANFAVLVQTPASARDGTAWLDGEVLPRYRDLSGGRPLVQRLGDFMAGSQPAQDWDALRGELPFVPSLQDLRCGPVHALFDGVSHAHLVQGIQRTLAAIHEASALQPALEEMLEQILVVGPELEFLWPRVALDADCQTARPGLFVVGDAAGHGQGIVPAMITGAVAAQAILHRPAQELEPS